MRMTTIDETAKVKMNAKIFQYEYALFEVISQMFFKVVTKSLCIDRLKLYFAELGHPEPKKKDENDTSSDSSVTSVSTYEPQYSKSKKKNQESVLAEVNGYVERDLKGNITFPLMARCQAVAKVLTHPDGTHSFIFTDGLYGFCVRLEFTEKGRPCGIIVEAVLEGNP